MLTPENIVVLFAKVQCLHSKLAAERSEACARLQNSLFSQSPVEKQHSVVFLGRLPTELRRNMKGIYSISISLLYVGYDLSFRSVSRQVFSALQSLTSVFGMGTGGPFALETLTMNILYMLIESRIKL